MTDLISSLDAHKYLRGSMTACSWQAGWRSLLLRAYEDPAVVDEFTTPPTSDHLIVLTTNGKCDIEGRYRGRWTSARYEEGSIGMTAPKEAVTLRWQSHARHRTLQLHIPSATINAVMEEVSERDASTRAMPHALAFQDTLVRQIILDLSQAIAEGAPDIYAESAAHYLTLHLLLRHGNFREPRPPSRDDARLRRVEAFIRQNLSEPVSLAAMAAEAGISRFHLLRLFKLTYGETPFKRLTRLRIEEAQRRLIDSAESVTEIAFSCGYDNPAHFASAFRRHLGVAPSAYRRAARS